MALPAAEEGACAPRAATSEEQEQLTLAVRAATMATMQLRLAGVLDAEDKPLMISGLNSLIKLFYNITQPAFSVGGSVHLYLLGTITMTGLNTASKWMQHFAFVVGSLAPKGGCICHCGIS